MAAGPLNNLGQGEAIMTAGGGHQTHSSGRWGDYSMLTIDPADNLSFWHTNEYYLVTSSASWFTRIGKFRFPAASPTPTPTATSTPAPSPTATATATVTPTATPTATPTPTPTQCVVPNFIGTQIRRATQTWVAAGFNSNNITTIGNPGQKITSQSLPAGFVGNCGTTTITVSH